MGPGQRRQRWNWTTIHRVSTDKLATQTQPHTPRTPLPPKRRPRFENRMSHVTATRRTRFRTTTRVERDGSPRYVPPALQDDKRTSQRSSLPNPGHSEGWRDPPPHKDPSIHSPKRSD